ncbi:60S ribosomal protein L35a-2 [Zea mays]|uniref:60S ribosomal protein L35a-2 n=1 Tax=Zea mays TaxID=4577 RepID=A0A1D6QCW2_MAIZE|nr:60S ribosomal protein L35a-2 [Zea mays]
MQVQVEPVRDYVAGADRGGEHQGGRRVVLREADGLHLQGQDQEQRHPLPLHLGQGRPPAWQLRRRPRQVQVQPAAGIHGP